MPARYGSDLVVDLLKVLGIEYVALNPGSSFRGIHDSLVNYESGRDAQSGDDPVLPRRDRRGGGARLCQGDRQDHAGDRAQRRRPAARLDGDL